MDNKIKETIEENAGAFLGIVSTLAIIIGLYRNGFETDEILGAIVNFTQVAIPVLVLIASHSMLRNRDSYYDLAQIQLKKLEEENLEYLSGPRTGHSDDEGKSENDDVGNRYLFIRRRGEKRKVKFVSVNALEKDKLILYIQKGTLVFGLGKKSEEANDALITEYINKVYNSLKKEMNDNKKKYETILQIENRDSLDLNESINIVNNSIVIEFDNTAIKNRYKKKFAIAIKRLTQVAFDSLFKNN